MSSRRRDGRAPLCGLAWMVVAAASLAVQASQPQQIEKASDNYDELFGRYLVAARAIDQQATHKSIRWMTDLVADPRARAVNDLLTVKVVESIVAVGSADSSLSKNSSSSASLTNLFGLESKFPSWLDATNLASSTSDTKFKGGGTTTRSGELSAVITARVAEVLPNGDLVLEAAREIDINGDRQIVVLTGVVRSEDVGPGNIILSTQIGQLRIRYFGRGLIKDNLKPGLLMRILNKIF